jgi:hypothetical protein
LLALLGFGEKAHFSSWRILSPLRLPIPPPRRRVLSSASPRDGQGKRDTKFHSRSIASAATIIFIFAHPSGDPEPPLMDKEASHQFLQANNRQG